MKLNVDRSMHELKHHLPLTITAVIFSTILVIIFKDNLFNRAKFIFEYSHFIHLFISSIVPSAMFYKYKKDFSKAIILGIISAILMGSISDVIFPYFAMLLLGIKTEFHLPLFENTLLVLSIVISGSIIGVVSKRTKIPHFMHIFISVFASLFYIVTFTSYPTNYLFIFSSIIVFISVIIPCCLSDIIFPVIFLEKEIKKCKICEHENEN